MLIIRLQPNVPMLPCHAKFPSMKYAAVYKLAIAMYYKLPVIASYVFVSNHNNQHLSKMLARKLLCYVASSPVSFTILTHIAQVSISHK